MSRSLYLSLAALAPTLLHHDALVVIAAIASTLLGLVGLASIVVVTLIVAAHRKPAAHSRIRANVLGVIAALCSARSPRSREK